MHGLLSELICSYLTPYSKRLTRSPSDAREYAALVDFQIKVALTLLAAYSVRTNTPIRLGDTPGVGEMLGGIRCAKKWSVSGDPVVLEWREFAEAFLGEFSRNIYGGKTFKTIRDELSHGHPIPVDDAPAAAIRDSLREFSEVISKLLEEQLSKFTYSISVTSIHASRGCDVQELSPLWNFNGVQGVVGIYSSFDSDGVYYLCPTAGVYRNSCSENTQLFREKFLGKDPVTRHFGQFVYEITRDIAGFSEDHSAPPYAFGEGERAGEVFVTWTHASSSGNTHRTDSFRRGKDNRYEWFDVSSNAWIGYSGFLRWIANWSVLARRVRIELEDQERRKQLTEMGTQSTVSGMKIPARLVEDSDANELPKAIDLPSRADGACLPSKSFTTVFFVVGDAGMGKTEYLLTLARERAQAVETDPECDKPLYLFVSSTGRVLSNLDDAINSSLSITRILDNQSAKALCRNGLLVLIVDGFDELLGSSGYDNPLGSLEGWFRDLRGRGVMIASARSAYYMTRYRRSLSETTDLNVDHTVAHIQSWSRENTEIFLGSYGVENHTLSKLSERDWRLLTTPFFAKAFATWRNGPQAPTDVFQVVVDQYLERESTKIVDQNNIPILSKPELQALFSEFAEMMHLGGRRELEQSDLELCASVALGVEDINRERPGLQRRLTSLCGLSAGEVVAGDAKFGFAHEVIYDCFLSLCLQRRCEAKVDKAYIGNFFARGAINPAVIEWFVAGVPMAAFRVLGDLLPLSSDSLIWRRNVGSLWSALNDHSDGKPPHPSASGLIFRFVELSKDSGTRLSMRGASFEHLKLTRDIAIIDVEGASIEYLEVDETSTLKKLHNIAPEMIQRVQSPDNYCDTTPLIRTALEHAGVIQPIARGATLEWLDTANYFINSLISRPEVPVVVSSDDLEPDNERLGWTTRLGSAKWQMFVNRLTQSGLASLEVIVASGRSKSRLMFNVSPADISRRNKSIKGVEEFWEGL